MGLTLIQFQYDCLPLGAVYLAYGLEKENINFEVKLFKAENAFKSASGIDKLYSFLINSREILAIGCYSDMLPYIIAALKKIKQKIPKKIVILGGVGPTIVAQEIMDSFDFIDFIIAGCGISSLPKLVKRIGAQEMEFDDIPSLLVRNKRIPFNNNFSGFVSEIPRIPAYHRIRDIDSYSVFSIKTSSGCPYRCTFCYASQPAGRKVINRDLSEVIDELRLIKKITRGRNIFYTFIDEAFVVNKKRVIEFCRLLRKNKLKVPWGCYGRIDCMDQELLRNLRIAGCVQLYYGVESGSNRVLEKIKKGFTCEEAVKILMLSKKYIPTISASFIYRYPFEKFNDFLDTFKMLKYLHYENIAVQLHPLAPVKNSELYASYHKRLRFSIHEPCDYLLSTGLISSLPKDCIALISNYHDVFYDYRYYNSEDFDKISTFIAKNPI